MAWGFCLWHQWSQALFQVSDNTTLTILPRETFHSQCSLHPFIPLCPVLLIFIHQFVYTAQGSGRKRQKYLLRHTPRSCWGCQNMELTALCFTTSWMFQSSLSQTPLLSCSFSFVLSTSGAWEVKPLLYAPMYSYNKCDFREKERRASSPAACPCAPLTTAWGTLHRNQHLPCKSENRFVSDVCIGQHCAWSCFGKPNRLLVGFKHGNAWKASEISFTVERYRRKKKTVLTPPKD